MCTRVERLDAHVAEGDARELEAISSCGHGRQDGSFRMDVDSLVVGVAWKVKGGVKKKKSATEWGRVVGQDDVGEDDRRVRGLVVPKESRVETRDLGGVNGKSATGTACCVAHKGASGHRHNALVGDAHGAAIRVCRVAHKVRVGEDERGLGRDVDDTAKVEVSRPEVACRGAVGKRDAIDGERGRVLEGEAREASAAGSLVAHANNGDVGKGDAGSVADVEENALVLTVKDDVWVIKVRSAKGKGHIAKDEAEAGVTPRVTAVWDGHSKARETVHIIVGHSSLNKARDGGADWATRGEQAAAIEVAEKGVTIVSGHVQRVCSGQGGIKDAGREELAFVGGI